MVTIMRDSIVVTTNKVVDRMLIITASVGALAVIIMMVAINVEVFSRYIFNNPTEGADEIVRFCNVYILFLGLGYALRENAHVSVELLVRFFPKKLMNLIAIITNIIGIAIALSLTYEGWLMFYDAYEFSLKSVEILRTPLVVPYLVLPWGCFLLLIEFVRQTTTSIKAFRLNSDL